MSVKIYNPAALLPGKRNIEQGGEKSYPHCGSIPGPSRPQRVAKLSKAGVLNLLEVTGQFENLVHVAGRKIDKSYIPLLGSNSEEKPKGKFVE